MLQFAALSIGVIKLCGSQSVVVVVAAEGPLHENMMRTKFTATPWQLRKHRYRVVNWVLCQYDGKSRTKGRQAHQLSDSRAIMEAFLTRSQLFTSESFKCNLGFKRI